jgi:hypothetical protein
MNINIGLFGRTLASLRPQIRQQSKPLILTAKERDVKLVIKDSLSALQKRALRGVQSYVTASLFSCAHSTTVFVQHKIKREYDKWQGCGRRQA